jgi:alpha-beta hydrolase superfamily lysophospholipase
MIRAVLLSMLFVGSGVSCGEIQSPVSRGAEVGKASLMQQIDHPAVNAAIFFPRPATGLPAPQGSEDLRIPLGGGVDVMARYHPVDAALPTVLHFHGNGEIVPDYDAIAPAFHSAGASLVSAEYRGYGSSTGSPSARGLIEDAPVVLDQVIAFLKERGHTGPLVVMGRSMGSAPAIELASTRGGDIAGLIVESGFARTEPLLALFGISLESLGLRDLSGMDNEDKMADVRMPVLVLHAEGDVLLPPWNGERIHERAASDEKTLVMIPNADHNTIMAFGGPVYWGAIAEFLAVLRK